MSDAYDPVRAAEELYGELLADPGHTAFRSGLGGLPQAAWKHLDALAKRDGFTPHECNLDDVGMDWWLTGDGPRGWLRLKIKWWHARARVRERLWLLSRKVKVRYWKSRLEWRRREREQQRLRREREQEAQKFFDRLVVGERVRLPFQEPLPVGRLRKLAEEARYDLKFDAPGDDFFTWFLVPWPDDPDERHDRTPFLHPPVRNADVTWRTMKRLLDKLLEDGIVCFASDPSGEALAKRLQRWGREVQAKWYFEADRGFWVMIPDETRIAPSGVPPAEIPYCPECEGSGGRPEGACAFCAGTGVDMG